METRHQRGQILIEVCVVISLIVLIWFAAFTQLTDLKTAPKKFQLTEDGVHASKNSFRY